MNVPHDGSVMRYAIYARYSSDLQNDRSIDDQIGICRVHIARSAGTVDEKHIYSDRAISGVSMTGRAGLMALLNAAAQKPRPFDFVLADDTSRLSRKMGEVQDLFDQLRFYGISVYLVSQDIDSRKENAYLSAGVHGLIDSQYRRDLAQKTLRGMAGQALRGYNAGGRLYGYRSVREFDPGGVIDRKTGQPKLLGARLEIHLEQAEVVKVIFELYLAGLSCRDIACQLNTRGTEPPHNSRQLARGAGKAAWLPNTIYLLLQNAKYAGDWSFNRMGWAVNPQTKQRRRIAKKPDEWQQNYQPHLTIIDKESFWAVQKKVLERKNGPSKRRTGAPSSFLLSGLMRCHECGGSYVVVNGTNRNKIVFGCCTHHKRGPVACSNDYKVTKDEIEAVILRHIQSDLLDPAILSALVRKVNKKLKAKLDKLQRSSGNLAEQRASLRRQLSNLVDAIAENGSSPALLTKLREIEAETATLDAQAQALARGYSYERLQVDEKYVAGWVERLKDRLAVDVMGAKAQLMSLIGEFTLTPEMREDVKCLRIDGRASVAGLLAVAVKGDLHQLSKYRGTDLNCRHPVPQTGALTN